MDVLRICPWLSVLLVIGILGSVKCAEEVPTSEVSSNSTSDKREILHRSPLEQFLSDPDRKDKILTGSGGHKGKPDDVSDTDLQFLYALEKLVTRFEKLEARLKRVEDLMVYLLQDKQGSLPKRKCPPNFSTVGPHERCYYFSRLTNFQRDWMGAHNFCQQMGAKLAEFETPQEHEMVANHLLDHRALRMTHFWTGGLNPGLLWLWGDSGGPVTKNQNYWVSQADQDHGSGTSSRRCLKLVAQRKTGHKYGASLCAEKDYFLCEYAGDGPAARHLDLFYKEINQGKMANKNKNE